MIWIYIVIPATELVQRTLTVDRSFSVPFQLLAPFSAHQEIETTRTPMVGFYGLY
jgi:hypothetical protein